MKRIILALMLIGSIGYTANRITNSDIASNAAIAFSKLAPLTSGSVLVGNGSNVATAVGLSGDVTLASSGAVTISNGAVALATDVTGTLPVANGGTGQTSYIDGQILIGNSTGNTLNKANLTAGSGITITNGPGSITIAASGGAASSGQMKAFWQGYHDDDCSFQVSTKDTQTQISDTTCTFVDSGPESTSFPTVSTSTDGGSTEYAGITFTTTMAGVYEVCAQYEVNLSDAGYVGMNMYDTTGGTRTANMNFRVVTANDSRAIRHCGFFTFASSVTPNIRIETYINGGTGTLTIGYSNGSTAGVFETIKWSIKVYEQ